MWCECDEGENLALNPTLLISTEAGSYEQKLRTEAYVILWSRTISRRCTNGSDHCIPVSRLSFLQRVQPQPKMQVFASSCAHTVTSFLCTGIGWASFNQAICGCRINAFLRFQLLPKPWHSLMLVSEPLPCGCCPQPHCPLRFACQNLARKSIHIGLQRG